MTLRKVKKNGHTPSPAASAVETPAGFSTVVRPRSRRLRRVVWSCAIVPFLFFALLMVLMNRDNPAILDALPLPAPAAPLPGMAPSVPGATFAALATPVPEREPSGALLAHQRIILWTNEARAQEMLPPLTENRQLDLVAAERVNDMLQRQYFAHAAPSGEGVAEAARRVGYRYRVLSENIAKGGFGDDERLVRGWLRSQSHRRNMLSPDIEEIGAAAGKGRLGDEIVWIAVQVFGKAAIVPERRTNRRSSGESGPCRKPNEYLNAKAENLRHEARTGRLTLDRLRSDIEKRRNTLLARARKDRALDEESAGDYAKRLMGYNLLMEEVKRKEQLARDMNIQYASEAETFNSCSGG